MDVRTLRYFVAIAREGSMTRAAERLHVTQPTLSRQVQALEQELGCQVFLRGSTSVSLTSEGSLLLKRAEDILALVDKTKDEFLSLGEVTGGDVRIGCAETVLMRNVAQAVARLRGSCPGLRTHVTSGDSSVVIERLDSGLLDFAVIAEPPNLSRYNSLELPGADAWGVVVPDASPLAALDEVRAQDLEGVPLYCSAQAIALDLPRWCGQEADRLSIAGTVNLVNNGTVFVREGLGALLCFDGLVTTGPQTGLAWRPLSPRLETREYVVWRKYQELTPVAGLLMDELRAVVAEQG